MAESEPICQLAGAYAKAIRVCLLKDIRDIRTEKSREFPCSFYVVVSIKSGRAAADRRVPRALDDLQR